MTVHSSVTSKHICLTAMDIDIVYDYIPETLKMEIDFRNKRNDYFTNEEFSSLVLGTINVSDTTFLFLKGLHYF